MKRERMVEATIWAIWWLVVGGAGLWVIVGSIGYFNKTGWLPSEAAGWAQAIGAGVAIVVASFIPMWHAKVATVEKQRNLLGVMRVLSDEALEKLWLLSNTFLKLENAPRMMREYLYHRREQDWSGLFDAVNKIPIGELPPDSARALGYLRDAVEFGQRVVTELPQWADRGYAQPDMVVALKAKRDLLALVRGTLPHIVGVSVAGKVDAQKRGEIYELRRPMLEPYSINGVKVFRHYIWETDTADTPIGAIIQCLFPAGRYECKPHYLPGFEWRSIDEAEKVVEKFAAETIGSDQDWTDYFLKGG